MVFKFRCKLVSVCVATDSILTVDAFLVTQTALLQNSITMPMVQVEQKSTFLTWVWVCVGMGMGMRITATRDY